jgi:hypothetical protein
VDLAGGGIEDTVAKVSAVLTARYGGPAGATAEAVRRMPAPEHPVRLALLELAD